MQNCKLLITAEGMTNEIILVEALANRRKLPIQEAFTLATQIFDKIAHFFSALVTFGTNILSSNIPSGPSYGVHISQLIRYARCCTYYDDFGYRHKLLVDRLLSQGYKGNRLGNFFQTCYGRYPDLVAKYEKSVRDMLNDLFLF